MDEIATVTIPLEEYIALRQKVELTQMLAEQLVRLEGEYATVLARIMRVEDAMAKGGLL